MNEDKLEPPKGVKSWKKWTRDVNERLHTGKPIAGPNTEVNEMPNGRQIVAKAGGKTSGTQVIAAVIHNGEAGYYIDNAASGFTPFP